MIGQIIMYLVFMELYYFKIKDVKKLKILLQIVLIKL